MYDSSPEARMRTALEEIVRMAHTPLNGSESEMSRVWRKDIESICTEALYPRTSLTK